MGRGGDVKAVVERGGVGEEGTELAEGLEGLRRQEGGE